MRLVNVHTLKLEEFMEGQVPPYAILSHRWTNEELTFKELLKDRADIHKQGYKKLLGACRTAANYDVDYVWVDTCCIDKRSSEELSESINSMFTWYENAKVCLAYLQDVRSGPSLDESFRKSVWFSRSWTLQELLVPRQVEFYDGQWTQIGSKHTNQTTLEEITRVARDVLDGSQPIRRQSVAERMSWAADRRATRPEDATYSLMGIFDVNMPLLYGEGSKAFGRLQEEILRRSADTTILCCGLNDSTSRLLASSPKDFGEVRGLNLWPTQTSCQFGITNIGLEIQVDVVRWDLKTFGILLGAARMTYQGRESFALLVRRHKSNFRKTGVVRINAQSTIWSKQRKLHVLWGNEERIRWGNEPRVGFVDDNPDFQQHHGFHIQSNGGITLVPVELRRGRSDRPRHVEALNVTRATPGFTCKFGQAILPAVAKMTCRFSKTNKCSIDLSFDFDGRPCCLVYTSASSDHGDVLRLSEIFPALSEASANFYEEHVMVPVQENSTGTASWFLRGHCRHGHTYAKLPAVVTGADREAWAIFIPTSMSVVPGFWTFEISREKPAFEPGSDLSRYGT